MKHSIIAMYLFPLFSTLTIGCMVPPTQSVPISSYLTESMKSWLGRTDGALLEACGSPTTVRKMPDGSKLIIYEVHSGGWFIASSSVFTDDEKTMHTRTVGVPTGGTYVTRQFTVSPDHVIV